MTSFYRLLVISLFLSATTALRAQDYPYDDLTEDEYVPQLRKKKDYEPKTKIPVERPASVPPSVDTVFGLNLQAGATYTFEQYNGYSRRGPGYAAALGFGWDMLRHPLSVELEVGFQQNMLGTSNKHLDLPVKFTTYYWTKVGPDSVFRIGVGSSLALRIVPATASSDRQMGVKPNWHLSMIYEYASFTFEPVLQIMELRSDNSFFSGAFYFGYRI